MTMKRGIDTWTVKPLSGGDAGNVIGTQLRLLRVEWGYEHDNVMSDYL